MAKILMVDDSASLRTVVKMALVAAGHEVVESGDPVDALSKIDGSFNLIISDVNMPGMSGIDLAKKIRATNKFVPILMLTTESSDQKKQEGKASGANAWMTKPFPPSSLVNAVSKLIK